MPRLQHPDFCARDETPAVDRETRQNPTKSSTLAGKSGSASAFGQYLLGGDQYRTLLKNNTTGHPQGDKPEAEWLEQWDRKWQALTDKRSLTGIYHLLPARPTWLTEADNTFQPSLDSEGLRARLQRLYNNKELRLSPYFKNTRSYDTSDGIPNQS